MISDDGIPPQTVPGSNELQAKRLIQVEPHLNWNFGMDSNFRVLYIGSAFAPRLLCCCFCCCGYACRRHPELSDAEGEIHATQPKDSEQFKFSHRENYIVWVQLKCFLP